MAEDVRIAGGYVDIYGKVDHQSTRRAADEVVREFHDHTSAGFHESGTRSGQRFSESVRTQLRDEHGRFRKSGGESGEGLGEGLGEGVGRGFFKTVGAFTGQVSNTLAGLIPSVFTPMGAVKSIGMLGAAGAAAGMGLQLLPPAIYAVGGAAAALPGMLAGGVAAIGALQLGAFGFGDAISEALNPVPGAAGAAAAASRNLANAEREERQAQLDLNRARHDAIRDLRDMSLAAHGARVAESGAQLALEDAQRNLAQVRASTRDPMALRRAQQQLDEAEQSLAEAKARNADMAEDNARAQTAGVEGSDRVVQALERQRQAHEAVLSAQEAAAAGAGSANQAYEKLAPNARAAVDEILRLKPAYADLQQMAQNRLFAGADKDIEKMSNAWLPTLRKDVKLLSDDWNRLLHGFATSISKPEAVAAFDRVAGAVDRLFDRFNDKTLDKLGTAFTDLVDKSSPFIESVGNDLLDGLEQFSDWIDEKAKDGSLQQFFDDASESVHDLLGIGKDLGVIFGEFFSIVAEDGKEKGEKPLKSIRDTLHEVIDWMRSPEGKESIKQWVTDAKNLAVAVEDIIHWIGKIEPVLAFVDKYLGGVIQNWDAAVAGFTGVWDVAFEMIIAGLRNTLNAADLAFGWIPGIGPKLHKAKAEFDTWAQGVHNDIASLRGPHKMEIDVSFTGTKAWQDYRAGERGDPAPRRWGGVSPVHAQKGLLSEGNIFTAGTSPLYAFAEPGTRRELFMPELGDPGRNRQLAAVAADWAGGTFTPSPPGIPHAGAPTPAQVGLGDVYILADFGDGVRQLVRGEIINNPGTVAAAAREGDRQRGFLDSGRKR